MSLRSLLRFTIDGVIIISFTLFTAYFTNRAGYLALGGDGYAHFTKIKFLVDFWPNINWFYFWGDGLPVFLWYAIMPYTFLVFFFKVFSSAAMAINAVNLLTFIMIGIGVYGIVYEVTRSRVASILAAFLTVPSPGLWYRIMVGTTPRTFGDGVLVLAIWFLVRALRESREGFLKFPTIAGLIVFTTLSFQAHFFAALLMSGIGFVIIAVVARGFSQKIKLLFLTFLPAFLLSFYFLVPFVLTEHLSQTKSSFGIFKADPIDLKLLVYHDPERPIIPGGGLLPIHLPLFASFLFAAVFLRKFKEKEFAKRVVLAFSFLFLFFLLFGVAIYLGFPANWYNIGFVPDEVFEYLSFVIPILSGILLWLVLPKNYLRYVSATVFVLLVALIIWQYLLTYPLQKQVPFHFDPRAVYKQANLWKMLDGQMDEKNYRYGHPATEIALWFNTESEIPQNRDFFPHGVLYPNWRSWQENAIYNPKWNDKMGETKFLLDWFAIRWLSLVPPISDQSNKEKFAKDEDFEFKVGSPASAESGVELKSVSPILSSTNAPAILVIGERANDRSYGPVMRILSTFNYNSQVIIPVRGKNALDDYNLEELVKFPLVFLYEYHINDPQKAGKLLLNYSDRGGKVIIDSSSFIADNKREAFEKSLGFRSVSEEATSGKWNFSPAVNDLTEGINFTQFSPPVYEDAPWKFLSVEKTSLAVGQEPVLLNNDRAVIFRQKTGSGELVWSGLNLPYHALSYQNQEEAKFLSSIIFDLLKREPEVLPKPQNNVQFINPQKRTVDILESSNGVLFKENYFFNWHASLVKDGRSEDLKIYPAGTDFMYIPFKQAESSGTVVLSYRRSLLEQASTVVSILSFLAFVILWVYFIKAGSEKFRHFSTSLSTGLIGRLTNWWHKDNEE